MQKTCNSETGSCQVVECDYHPHGYLIFVSKTLFLCIIWAGALISEGQKLGCGLSAQLCFGLSIEVPSACLGVPGRGPDSLFFTNALSECYPLQRD